MANAVVMPKAGITVESCIIGQWQKKVGDQVAVGDILFTYETDKASFECESTASGELLEIFFGNGDEVPCLVNVCAVGTKGEDVSALRPGGKAEAAPAEAASAAPSAPAAPAPAAAPLPKDIAAVIMPKAGITVESCVIGQWQKKVGDQVAVGDILFTYETDKASFECESTAAGELIDIFFGNGDEVPCLTNVCVIGKRGEDYSALRPGGETESAPASAPEAAVAVPAAAAPAAVAAAVPAGERKGISPRARKLAAAAGVDAALASPTGPQGRIIERDVRTLMAAGIPAAAPAAETAPVVSAAAPVAPAPAPVPEAEAAYEDVKFSNVRKVTAKGMMRSLTTMAQLTLHYSFDATQLQQYRKLLKEMDGPMARISLNDMILFAVSRTLPSCPDLNANTIADDVVRRFRHVNLGFACDTPRGLLVPTIPNADTLSLLELSLAAKELAAKAREGKISPDQLQGGTFSVTNLGSTGCEMFTPVINPPQTGILGVCNIQTKIRTGKGGEIVPYPAMGLSITFDHRVLDGAPVGRFMQELCGNLEHFLTLLAK